MRALGPTKPGALSLVGLVAGALGVFALVALFTRIDAQSAPALAGSLRAALTVTSPLYWVTAARPLSDVPGLAASVAVQALTLSAATPGAAIAAAFFSALVIGIRSQAAWLTLPLLIFVILRSDPHHRVRLFGAASIAFIAGCAVWAVPLLVMTGGPAAYWRALFDQGTEDLTGVQMLWTTPTVRQLASALYHALRRAVGRVADGAPRFWLLAAIGAVVLMWRSRGALVILAVAFAPYFVFDLAFQETFTTRYALPSGRAGRVPGDAARWRQRLGASASTMHRGCRRAESDRRRVLGPGVCVGAGAGRSGWSPTCGPLPRRRRATNRRRCWRCIAARISTPVARSNGPLPRCRRFPGVCPRRRSTNGSRS